MRPEPVPYRAPFFFATTASLVLWATFGFPGAAVDAEGEVSVSHGEVSCDQVIRGR